MRIQFPESWSREVVSKFMAVKGACLALHADRIPLPMPFLRTVARDTRRSEFLECFELGGIARTYTENQLCSFRIFHRWEIDRVRGKAMRHHMQPRTAMFSPREDEGPVKLDDLKTSRLTTPTPFEPGPKLVIRDEWTSRDHARPALEKGRWAGTTAFILKVAEDDYSQPPRTPSIRAADRRERELDRQADAEAETEEGSGRDEQQPILLRSPTLTSGESLYDYLDWSHRTWTRQIG